MQQLTQVQFNLDLPYYKTNFAMRKICLEFKCRFLKNICQMTVFKFFTLG